MIKFKDVRIYIRTLQDQILFLKVSEWILRMGDVEIASPTWLISGKLETVQYIKMPFVDVFYCIQV
jgi:hypothetical protein